MKCAPIVTLASVTATLAVPLVALMSLASKSDEALWIAAHQCARASAAVPALLAVAATLLAASSFAAALTGLGRDAWRSHRAVRAAARAAVAVPERLHEEASSLGIRRLLVIASSERIALCAGLLRPRVIISTGTADALDGEPLRAVLAHEAAHAARRDPLRHVLAAAAARSAWFIPAAGALVIQRRVRHELAADRAALRCVRRPALAVALLTMHASSEDGPAEVAAAGAWLPRRVDALLGARTAGPRPWLAGLWRSVVGIALAVAVAAGAVVAPAAMGDSLHTMPMDAEGTLDMTASITARLIVLVGIWAAARSVVGRTVIPARLRRSRRPPRG